MSFWKDCKKSYSLILYFFLLEMREAIQSAGWIIYYIDKADSEPRFLLLKRYALSKKIEWVAPKGKITPGETPAQAASREIFEEVWIDPKYLVYKEKIGDVMLSLSSEDRGTFDKDIAYFLFQFTGDPQIVNIAPWEGYIWVHKWCTISEVLWLIYYSNFRELFRKSYLIIKNPKEEKPQKKENVLKINSLKLQK